MVLCLNLTGCEIEKAGQVRVRFQFGTWNADIKHWECCPISNIALNLENSHQLLSLGYETLKISDRHFNAGKIISRESNLQQNNQILILLDKDISIMVKIQVIQSDEEKQSLCQDLARVLSLESQEFSDTVVECSEEEGVKSFKAHSFLIKARSPILAMRLCQHSDEINQVSM